MAINLQKGQRVEIGLTKVCVGLGWDPNTSSSSADYDLDASAFMLGSNGKIPSDNFFVFYGDDNHVSADGAVSTSGDDTTGGNSDGGDDETLTVDITRLDPRIEQIVFVVTIYEAVKRKQNFGQVRNSYIRIYNAVTQEEICKYELGEDFSVETGVEFGRLYKRNGQWKFEAIGQGYVCKGALGLEDFVSKYK